MLAWSEFSIIFTSYLFGLYLLLSYRYLLSLVVPHFEKMLYDQGQLVSVYLDVFSLTKDVFYSSMSRDILDYLRREMIGPSGEVFSAEDADSAEFEGASRKKEGAFYVWTSQEVYTCPLIPVNSRIVDRILY